MDDAELLRQYVETGSHEAFRGIVQKHIGLVYATALRQVRDKHLAEDVTQAVFIVLARKAKYLSRERVLAAWLMNTAKYASRDAIKSQSRRRKHETKAAEMKPTSVQPDVDHLDHPVDSMLNVAMDRLGEGERRAVMLKYYERKTFGEIGSALGIKEEAARKRVTRATEKMRTFFARRGTVLSAGALMSHLYFRLAPPASAALMEKVMGAALNAGAGAAVAGGVAGIAANVMRSMAMVKAAMVTAYAASIVLLIGLAGVVGYGAHTQMAAMQSQWRSNSVSWPQQEVMHVARIERR